MVRENLITVGVKHAARVGAARAARDLLPGNTVGVTVIRAAILAAVYHFISRRTKYIAVDTEIIDAEIV